MLSIFLPVASCKTRAGVRSFTLRGVALALSYFTHFLSIKRNPYLIGPRKKKALIVGINYARTCKGKLRGSIADAVEAKNTLTDFFGFKEEDIILLVDEEDGSDLPTYERILHELNNFVKCSDSNVDYVFIYVGHASQSDAKSERALQEEEDGKREYIMPLDALSRWGTPITSKIIYDRELRSYLVDQLGHGSKLLTIFNACHSATLLNLRHYKCHRGGNITSLFRRLVRNVFCDPMQLSVVRQASDPNQCIGMISGVPPVFAWRLQSTTGSTGSLCTGLCHTENKGLKYPRVVCISGCKDSERTPESDSELSMVASLMRLLRDDPRPTFKKVMNTTRENVRQTRFKCVGSKGDLLAALSHFHRHVFTKLQPWHPQLAAEHTIDLDQKLIVCLS